MLREARHSARLRQTDLAKKLDQPQSVISKIERGERRIDLVELFTVTEALGLDPVKFVSEYRDELQIRRRTGFK